MTDLYQSLAALADEADDEVRSAIDKILQRHEARDTLSAEPRHRLPRRPATSAHRPPQRPGV